jgi:hypothetical protein
MEELITIGKIESKIFQIRGRRVILDEDLAILYGVLTKQLIRQVQRNIKRFPDDFMFLLTRQEVMNLKCQIGTSSWGGRRYLPYAFTEEGVAMLSSVLNSEKAIVVNIHIMRVFVRLRRTGLTYAGLKRKINEMEKKYDSQFGVVFEALKKLLAPPPIKPKPQIGFK